MKTLESAHPLPGRERAKKEEHGLDPITHPSFTLTPSVTSGLNLPYEMGQPFKTLDVIGCRQYRLRKQK